MADYGKGDVSWFKHDRFGMFIHWGLYAVPARHEWLKNYERIPDEVYNQYFDMFDPDRFDPKAWAKAAANAGMKYFVFTTKHHEGFCLFDSHYTDFKITNTKYGKDAVREIVEAFRAEGLKVGLYHSLIDWHHPDYLIDSVNHPFGLGKSEAELAEMNRGKDQKRYIGYLHNSVRQLLTEYGKIDIIWFDFSFPPEVFPTGKGKAAWDSEGLVKLIRSLQPDIIINNRLNLDGSGDVFTPEQTVPEEPIYVDPEGYRNTIPCQAWEGCQTFSGAWGYHRDEYTWKSPKQCIDLLINHVCRDGNLLMNVGPTARGEMDSRALNRLEVYGEWMRDHKEAIYGCGMAPAEYPEPRDCRYTWNPEKKRLYLHIMNWPFGRVLVKGLAGKLAYAQLMKDKSQIRFKELPDGRISLNVPVIKPDTEVPVIELFLK